MEVLYVSSDCNCIDYAISIALSAVVSRPSNLLLSIYEVLRFVNFIKKKYIYSIKKKAVQTALFGRFRNMRFFRNIPPSIVIKLRM